jgi:FkbM family methyltransferase
MRRFGTRYAGFFYPSELPNLDENSIIYCVGAGEDISHDIDVANTCKGNVHIFDPTPRAIQHVKLVKEVIQGTKEPIANKRYGGGDPEYWNTILTNSANVKGIHLYEWGIHTKNESGVRFYLPSNPDYVSCSLLDGMKGKDYIEVVVKTLEDTMKELGHDHIDFLKLDIEGSECDVIEKMLESSLRPKYLSVDFDLGWTGEYKRDLPRCKEIIRNLMNSGYTLLEQHGPEWSFQYKD